MADAEPTPDQAEALESAAALEARETHVHFRESIAEECCGRGWLQKLGGGYYLTPRGRMMLRALCGEP